MNEILQMYFWFILCLTALARNIFHVNNTRQLLQCYKVIFEIFKTHYSSVLLLDEELPPVLIFWFEHFIDWLRG